MQVEKTRLTYICVMDPLSLLIRTYFDSVLTKYMINNRAKAWKTDVNLLNSHLLVVSGQKGTGGSEDENEVMFWLADSFPVSQFR